MVQPVFPNIKDNYQNVSWLTERAILTTEDVHLKVLNDLTASQITASEREFLSADSVEETKFNELNYPVELLNSLPGTGSIPDHKLSLKDGHMVMLLQNIQPKNGHVNNAR